MAQIQDGGHTYGASKHSGVSKHEGHPNIQGASKCMGAYGHSLSVTKHAFFVLYMYGGIQTLSKLTGGVQTSKHVGIQTNRGASKHMRASKHTGDVQAYGSIQTYRGPSKHMGASKHTGSIHTYGGI